MEQRKVAKAGSYLMADSGEYSDKSIHGFFEVLKDFDPMAELEEFLNEHPDMREPFDFSEDAFLVTLLAKGYLREIDYDNLYLSGYHDAGDAAFYPGPQ